jgi:hypothetical protein
MTEVPPPENDEDVPPPLPSWVPVLIGGVLVVLAALAVFTGLRYRQNTLVSIVKPPRTMPQLNTPAPPGEPEAGGSLIFDGSAPAAHPPVAGRTRATITGTGGEIESNVHITARRGMVISVFPDDAVVYVNDMAVGQAKQFASQAYEFATPGSYTIRIAAPGYRDRIYTVTVRENASEEVARIEARLTRP